MISIYVPYIIKKGGYVFSITPKVFKVKSIQLLYLFLMSGLSGCISTPSVSREAEEQLRIVGTGYGVVVGVRSAFDKDFEKLCNDGKGHKDFLDQCPNLKKLNAVTANVAATSGKSFLKVFLLISNEQDVRVKDIVQFKFSDLNGFIRVASRGERADCKWNGNSPLTMGFPGMAGGIECDGWSYKSILHIDWLNR